MTSENHDDRLGEKIGIYRLLDANFNRSFEAFRVIEDVVRFSFDNILITELIKEYRHALKAVIINVGREIVAYRDVLSDVGTDFSDPDEETRTDRADLVHVNFGRLKESLRSIEEGLKVFMPHVAPTIKRLRYNVYDLEKRTFALLDPKKVLENARLCVIVGDLAPEESPIQKAREAVKGGAEIIQLRCKTVGEAELLKIGRGIREITAAEGALYIMNDHVDLALLTQADGVHLGQEDMPVAQARKILGSGRIIGKSTHDMNEVDEAVSEGADYIGVGCVFESSTKPEIEIAGLDFAGAVANKIKNLPLFAIGGVNIENVSQLIAHGVYRVAVSSAVTSAASPREAAAALRENLGFPEDDS